MKEDRIITNLDLLWYAVKILIIFAETSEMPYHFRSARVNKLQELKKELGCFYD